MIFIIKEIILQIDEIVDSTSFLKNNFTSHFIHQEKCATNERTCCRLRFLYFYILTLRQDKQVFHAFFYLNFYDELVVDVLEVRYKLCNKK